MKGGILDGEPVCYYSRDYLDREGLLEDTDEEYVRDGRGPFEDCACDVCFYGARAHWLAGRESLAGDYRAAMFLLRQAFGYQHLGWATDGTWPDMTEQFLREQDYWPEGARRVR